ncbi:unnamed protein product [Camellia sinensis]
MLCTIHGDNLPSDQEVVQLYQSNGIGRMRMYGPNPSTLEALRGSNIELVLDVPNSDLPALGSDPSAASQWVQNNVGNYFPGVKFRYISVGNEVDPNKADTAQYVQFVLPAMQNVYNAIAALGLQDQIKVSTATYSALVSNSYPPSQGSFDGVKSFMEPIIQFLATNKSPLLANIYPYFAYNGDQQHITLPYALFTATGVVVQDDQSGYQNLFDAMLDAMYSAVEKAGGPGVEIVVSESGWPSDGGGAGSTLDNAGTYYKNLIQHVNGGSGTPKRPGKAIETYLFAMFDENKKDGAGTEQHFGLFSPNKQPKYQIAFNYSLRGSNIELDKIKVSTARYSALVSNPYPPSQGSFDGGKTYALFTASGDQSGYQNLFDALLDAMYSAVEKAGGPGVEIVVSETGWPSQGHEGATKQNAETYYQNMIKHVKAGSGTPKRPGKAIQVYVFAMFDENNKTGEETERNFGLFYPNKQPKYHITFN